MLVAANGWWIWWILFIIVWVAIAFWPLASPPARATASSHFIFSLFFFPAALIVAYLVRDKRSPA